MKQLIEAHSPNNSFQIELSAEGLYIGGERIPVSFEKLGEGTFHVLLHNKSYTVFIQEQDNHTFAVSIKGKTIQVQLKDEQQLLLEKYGLDKPTTDVSKEVHAPMPGLVLSVEVTPNQVVQKGDALLVLEAMKMENIIKATTDGVIQSIHTKAGEAVAKNQLLVSFA